MSTNELKVNATKTEILTEVLSTARGETQETFFGTTEAATQTELFIDGVNMYRIQPPKESVGYIEFVCTGYNVTDSTVVAATKTNAAFSRLGTTMAVTQGTDVTNVYNDAQCQVLADDINDYITVMVTPADADKTQWQVHATIYCHSVGEMSSIGNYDGIPKG